MKFRFIDSSETCYGIAKQLEYHMTQLGMVVSEAEGVTLCYANDIGSYMLDRTKPMTPDNHWPLQRAVASSADILLCSQVACMKWFQRAHVYYLPSAANTQLLFPYGGKWDIPIGFCGNITYPSRQNFLEVLLTAFPGDFPAATGLYFEDLGRYYSRCKIVVNDCQWSEVSMRAFEATACGACLVTRRVPGIANLFEENVEAVFFDEWPEMVVKVRYLLANGDVRSRIALAGMKRTHRDHTYTRRAQAIKEIVGGWRE